MLGRGLRTICPLVLPPLDFVLPSRHGLVDACFLATIETNVTVARQVRIESGHGEGLHSIGAFHGRHSD
jgi:hypothetical protein